MLPAEGVFYNGRLNKGVLNSTILAPCKINIHLEIGSLKKNSGFHNIKSVFLLSKVLADTLEFKITGDKKAAFHIRYDLSFLPSELSKLFLPLQKEDDIIYKAFKLFQKETKTDFSVELSIKKEIPAGAGLGGSSSCAAAALKIFNRSNKNILNKKDLLKTGLELGSDVPFFLSGVKAAYVTGRGEKIRKIAAPRLHTVVINPLFSSSTARAYKMLDFYRQNHKDNSEFRGNIRLTGVSKNDFLEVFLADGTEEEKTAYSAMIKDFRDSGALFYGLSGSGSTCFGLFKNRLKAEKARELLSQKWRFVR